MAKKYEDSKGNFFDTYEEAKSSNLAMKNAVPSPYVPTPANTIDATRLSSSNPTPLKTQDPIPQTASTGLITMASTAKDQYITERDAQIKKLETETSNQQKEAKGLFAKLGMAGKNKIQMQEDEGLNKARDEVDQIVNQMEQRNMYYTRRIQDLEDKNPEGLFGGGLQDEVNKLNKENAREQADYAITLNAKQRRFDSINSIVDAKAEAETDDLKTQLDALKFFYDDNKSTLTSKEKERYQEIITEDERKYNDARDLRKEIGNLQATVATNGAPMSVVQAVGRAETLEQAITSGSQYLQDATDKRIKQLQIQKLEKEIANDMNNGLLVPEKYSPIPTEGNRLSIIEATKSKDVPAGTKTQLANILGVSNAAEDWAGARQAGKFKGLGVGSRILNAMGLGQIKSEDTINNEQAIEAINLQTQVWASGAALTDAQTEQVKRLTPTKGDSDYRIRSKLTGLYNYIMTQAQTELQSAGVNFVPAKTNLFEIYDLLQRATPEQRKELEAELGITK